MATPRSALYIPNDISPSLRKSLVALIERVRTIEDITKDVSTMLPQDQGSSGGSSSGGGDKPVVNDTTPPVAPTNLYAAKHENRNRLTWTNSISSDCVGTFIYRIVGDETTAVLIGVATFPQAIFNDLDTTPFEKYRYYIRAVDDAGNLSELVPAVDEDANTILPTDLPAPDAVLSNTWAGDDLNLFWDPVDGFGVAGYQVEIKGRRTIDVIEPSFSYTFAMNVEDGLDYEVIVSVRTIGSNGSLSVDAATATFTHIPPAVPIGATTGVTDSGFSLIWQKPDDASVTGYDVALNDNLLETGYTTEFYIYKTLLLAGAYYFQVRSRNKFDQTSDWNTQIYVVRGPNAPTNLWANVIDNTVMLYWDPPSEIELPIVEYEVRRGDVMAPGNIIGRKKGTFTTVQETVKGTYRYMVAAIDSAGNIGPEASVSAYVDEPPDFVLNVKWEDDFLFGMSTNVFIFEDGEALAPCSLGTWDEKFIGTGTSGSPQFDTFQDIIDAGYIYYPEPVPLTAEYSEEHDYGTILRSSAVSVSLTKMDYHGGPDTKIFIGTKENAGDVYTEAEGAKGYSIDFRYVRDRFEFTSDGKQFSILNMHTLQLDSKMKSDTGKSEIADATTGVWVDFNKSFVDITFIGCTAIGAMEPLQFIPDFLDEPYPTGFRAYFVTQTGKFWAGPIMWEARGY